MKKGVLGIWLLYDEFVSCADLLRECLVVKFACLSAVPGSMQLSTYYASEQLSDRASVDFEQYIIFGSVRIRKVFSSGMDLI